MFIYFGYFSKEEKWLNQYKIQPPPAKEGCVWCIQHSRAFIILNMFSGFSFIRIAVVVVWGILNKISAFICVCFSFISFYGKTSSYRLPLLFGYRGLSINYDSFIKFHLSIYLIILWYQNELEEDEKTKTIKQYTAVAIYISSNNHGRIIR